MKLTPINNPLVALSEVSVPPTAGTIPRRETSSGNIRVANTPENNYHAASKLYVDGKIPTGLELRVDNTVGTRIFAGTTMIQGDTGWRNIADSMINGWKGNLYIRRINNVVYLRGSVIAATATAGYPIDLMSGFRPGILTGPAGNDYGAAFVFTAGNSPAVKSVSCYFDRFTIAGYAPTDTYMVNVSWPTSNSWPATLPGLPA